MADGGSSTPLEAALQAFTAPRLQTLCWLPLDLGLGKLERATPRLERLTLLRRRFPPTRAVRSLTAAHFDCAGRAQVCAPPPSISRNGGGVA